MSSTVEPVSAPKKIATVRVARSPEPDYATDASRLRGLAGGFLLADRACEQPRGAHPEGDVARSFATRVAVSGFAGFRQVYRWTIPYPMGNHQLIRLSTCRVPAGLRHLFTNDASFSFTEPRCRVCVSPFRESIERMTVAGATYSFIARRTPSDRLGRKVDRRSISNHHLKHMEW